MNRSLRTLSAALALSRFASAHALEPGDVLDNFRLLDHRGKAHELHYLSDMSAVVLMTQANSCDVARKSVARLNEIRERYEAKGVVVLMINSSLDDDRASIAKEMERLGASIPVLDDTLQLIGESLEATQAGEVLVINPAGWKLAYRGPVSSAAEAIDAVLTGSAVKNPTAPVRGCSVSMPEHERRAGHAKISYAAQVAPILIEKCVTCHRQGGIGPWQMTSYAVVRGFAPMIREVLRTQRMPPWHADPHYGAFKNDRSLSGEQTKTLVHWIEAGAPQDKAADPLATLQKTWPEWELGPPHLIVETPPFNVPATGTVPYQYVSVKNTLGRDVWVRAMAFNPGARSVVHHILAYGAKPGGTELPTYLAGYVPGGSVVNFPDDTGVLLRKDMDLLFAMHYTTSGKPATDVTRIGLYFTDAPAKHPLHQVVLFDLSLRIPPNAKEHTIVAPSYTFDRDVLIYWLTAHSHYRGKASKFVAFYPDGREETLLSVPKYDFNWQTTYDLEEPQRLPKGTKLVYETTYDNSRQNPANPDPSIEVRWGEQSREEMIYGNVRYRDLDEATEPGRRGEGTSD